MGVPNNPVEPASDSSILRERLTFGSFCSGIEAPSEAWGPLGWQCAYTAEIEPFPAAYLAHRHGAGRPLRMPRPEDAITPKAAAQRRAAIKALDRVPTYGIRWGDRIPNYGDVAQIVAGELPAVDIIAAGFPCQGFSIAGLRGSLADARGELSIVQNDMAVRRITVTEAERLQGFPDDATLIPWPSAFRDPQDMAETVAYLRSHGLSEAEAAALSRTPDGPRYKAIGNSWPVNVAAWIGRRLDASLAAPLSGGLATRPIADGGAVQRTTTNTSPDVQR